MNFELNILLNSNTVYIYLNVIKKNITKDFDMKINRRDFIAGMGVASIAAGTPAGAKAGADAPNVIVFVADDAGWKDFGCYGNKGIKTPNIDRLAEGGLLFENAFLTAPQCSPSRISVLTGRYPHHTRTEDLHMPLPAGEEMLPTWLRKGGYFTGHMRKTHYGPEGEKQFNWYSRNLDDFSDFLDKSGENPFFMWVGFQDPHRDYDRSSIEHNNDPASVTVPPQLVDDGNTRSDLADYYDEISRMDRNIGEMLETLEEKGLSENTLVIFFSDNGMPFPGAKGTLYDSGVGTPLIFSWPGKVKPGSRCSSLASSIDLAPTILEAAGLRVPETVQGVSMLNRVVGGPEISGREYVFGERNWHNCDEHMRYVRGSRFKLIRNAYTELPFGNPADVSMSPSWYSLMEKKEKGELSSEQARLFTVPRPAVELYDLEKDPGEFTNLAGDPEFAGVVRELGQVLDKWMKETGDFPSWERRRPDNTCRITGVKYTFEIKDMRDN